MNLICDAKQGRDRRAKGKPQSGRDSSQPKAGAFLRPFCLGTSLKKMTFFGGGRTGGDNAKTAGAIHRGTKMRLEGFGGLRWRLQ